MWGHLCPAAKQQLFLDAGTPCAFCSLGSKLDIEHEGQPFVDEPIYAAGRPIKREVGPSAVSASVASALGASVRPAIEVTIPNRFRRTPLRWMKPDGKGGLVPK